MTKTDTNTEPAGQSFENARFRRANSPKFQRLCAKSREWQNAIDAKRHSAALAAAKDRRAAR
jgi:hypothetical protein